jgi:uncharacterized protein (TIGR03435 family)
VYKDFDPFKSDEANMRNKLMKAALMMAAMLFVGISVFGQSRGSPAFDVASIRQSVFPSDAFFAGYTSSGTCNARPLSLTGNRLALSRVTLCTLISMAYDVRGYMIFGAPNWMTRTDRSLYYDVQATSSEPLTSLTPERLREMLKTLLAERFQLSVHREMRELPVFELVVGKGGPKFNLSPEGPCAKSPNKDATFIVGPGLYATCKPRTSMADLVQMLSRETNRPVLDTTGLTGQQPFELRWDTGNRPPDAEPLPLLFTAVQEQLGLRLEAQRAQMEVLVIDRAERPTEDSRTGRNHETLGSLQFGLKLESQKVPLKILVVDHVEKPSEN